MMFLLKKVKDRQINKIISEVKEKNKVKKYIELLMGCLIVAFAFNLFFLRFNIVCFGVSGISIILSKFGVNPSMFILIANLVLLIISYFFLGVDYVKNQIIGALIYPLFIRLTLYVTDLIDLSEIELILVAIIGGILTGIGSGFIYKSGFSTGGTDVIGALICKYSKISMGNAMMITDVCIVLLGKLLFSWDTVMYAIVVAYLISIATDKILLGISNSKAFYIVVDKDKEDIVNSFLLSLPGVGSTIINVNGGSSNEKQTLLLVVAPTKMYFVIKEGLTAIDKNIFYLVCDSYEVSNRDDKE